MTNTQLQIIKKALFDVEMIELKRLEAFPAIQVEHSKEYTLKINSLIERERKRESSVFVWSPKRKGAVLVAVILILTLTITACAFGEQIKGFFVDIYETFTRLGVEGEPSDVPFEQYTFDWMPEEYTLIDNVIANNTSRTVWYNGKHQIYLEQDTLSSNSIIIDTENSQYEITNIGEVTVYYTYKNNTYTALWMLDNYQFCLVCHDSIAWCDIEKMIENMSSAK